MWTEETNLEQTKQGDATTPKKEARRVPPSGILMENGRPRLETKHGIFDDQFLTASSQGTRPDVGGRLAGAYWHCRHGMLPIPADFRHGCGAD